MDDTSQRDKAAMRARIAALEELVQRLQGENRLLETIIDKLPNQVFWKDRDLVYLGCNQAFAESTGMKSPSAVVGKTDFEFARDSCHAESYREWDRRVVTTGEAVLHLEERFHNADGQEGTVITHKIPLRNEAGEVMGVLGVCTDITERKQIEAQREALMGQLEAALAEVRELSKQKTRYVSIVSHNLRNPLSVITGLTSLLLARTDEAKPREFLNRIIEASSSMVDLLDRVLNVVRFESGQMRPELGPLDLASVATDCLRRAEVLAEAKHQQLDARIEPTLVVADVKFVQEVLDNLLSNAMKYSMHGKKIRVVVSPHGDYGCISVTDEGPGIRAQDMPRLFEQFTRLSARPTAGEPSVGLGLAISKYMVEAMNGQIEVDSSEGSGATFRVRLPAWSSPS
jgi:PAS domain S-box-containing protein